MQRGMQRNVRCGSVTYSSKKTCHMWSWREKNVNVPGLSGTSRKQGPLRHQQSSHLHLAKVKHPSHLRETWGPWKMSLCDTPGTWPTHPSWMVSIPYEIWANDESQTGPSVNRGLGFRPLPTPRGPASPTPPPCQLWTWAAAPKVLFCQDWEIQGFADLNGAVHLRRPCQGYLKRAPSALILG